MIIIEKKKSVNVDIAVSYGDLIDTNRGLYFVSCDGHGQYYFVNLSDNGFVRAKNDSELYKVDGFSYILNVGDILFPGSSIRVNAVHKKENFKITVELP